MSLCHLSKLLNAKIYKIYLTLKGLSLKGVQKCFSTVPQKYLSTVTQKCSQKCPSKMFLKYSSKMFFSSSSKMFRNFSTKNLAIEVQKTLSRSLLFFLIFFQKLLI